MRITMGLFDAYFPPKKGANPAPPVNSSFLLASIKIPAIVHLPCHKSLLFITFWVVCVHSSYQKRFFRLATLYFFLLNLMDLY